MKHAPASGRRGAWNTLCLELYHVIVRVGWIFKTETIIMPAVLDAVVDSGTLRGLLPVLNRGGQSLPPLFLAGVVGRRPIKKWSLVTAALAKAGCFAALACAWTPLRSQPGLLATAFLVLYALFSGCNGISQLVAAALQGKLIPAGSRGRSLMVNASVGGVLAILAAIVFLRPWLAEPDGFTKIFAVTAAFFALAAVVPAFLDEPPDAPAVHAMAAPESGTAARFGQAIAEWRRTLMADRALVRLAVVAACFSGVIMLFPHYQAFARDRLGTPLMSLLTWVVVQNVSTGCVSLVAGPTADRRGTRVVLIWLVALSSLVPLVVTGLSLLPHALAADWFWLVYLMLGLNPISLQIFTNYALELAPRPVDHARYVSIVGAALAAPFVLSPFVGWLVDAIGFRSVFVAGAAVIATGAAVAVKLPEPRGRSQAGSRAA
jgi:MFS family permease